MRAILFDLDDTLYHRQGAFTAWTHTFVERYLDCRDEDERRRAVDRIVGLDANGYGSKQAIFETLRPRYPALAANPLATPDRFYDEFLATISHEEGTEEFLDLLAEGGIPWGIITNGGMRQYEKIARLGLDLRAGCVLVSHVFGCGKPDPRIFHAALAKLNVQASDTLFVGDHPVLDIQGAAAVGMATAWMHRDRPWPAELADVTPTYRIARLSNLREVVLGDPER